MTNDRPVRRTGSAYDLPPPAYDETLVTVAKGTPAGELLRRYWHPVALSAEIKDLPMQVRALGEDLILFRTREGKIGAVHPRCAHRGTSLFYGKVEERGIRCCYHGWLFDTEGRCLEQPCEPQGGTKRENYRQPWYPAEERYGLVFAYLGPLEKKPPLPRYDTLETLGEDHFIVASGDSIGSGGPERMPCNWFQTHENVMDPFHVFVLHSTFSTKQFNEMMAVPPEIYFGTSAHGCYSVQLRKFDDGTMLRRITEIVLPNIRTSPIPSSAPSARATALPGRCRSTRPTRASSPSLPGRRASRCRHASTAIPCMAARPGTSLTPRDTSACPAISKRR